METRLTVQNAGIALSVLVVVLMMFILGRSYGNIGASERASVELLEIQRLESEVINEFEEALRQERAALVYEMTSLEQGDTTYTELDSLLRQLAATETRSEISEIFRDEFDAAKQSIVISQDVALTDLIKLGAKVLFSFIFGISALYVVLSDEYPQNTQNWAFGVLALIAGVWIGTM